MNWAFWAIPLIGLAVWVLSTIFRDLDERMEKERRSRKENADGGERVRVSQRSGNELDRFLEEARRRREPPRRRREKPPRQAPAILTAQPVAEPAKRKPMAPPVERPVPTMKPAAEVEAVLVTPAPTFPAPPPPAPAEVASQPGQASRPRKQAPALDQVRALLKDRSSLAAVFLLREVFDPPLSLRRRHDRP